VSGQRRDSGGLKLGTDLLDGGFEPAFNLVEDQIGQVHMRDLFIEEYPWAALLGRLAEMQFQGYCFAEIPASAIRRSRAHAQLLHGTVPRVPASVAGPALVLKRLGVETSGARSRAV
jgi:hypothetical protein